MVFLFKSLVYLNVSWLIYESGETNLEYFG